MPINMRYLPQYLLIATIICAALSLTYAVGLLSYGTFLYSNECLDAETGEPTGGALKLTHAPKADKLTYEWSTRRSIKTTNAIDVHIGPQMADGASDIRFTISPVDSTVHDGQPHELAGTISSSEVRISGPGIPEVMPRRKLDFKPGQCPAYNNR
jgi:hypothetical protein